MQKNHRRYIDGYSDGTCCSTHLRGGDLRASAAEQYPVVYLEGQGQWICDAYGNTLYAGDNFGAILTDLSDTEFLKKLLDDYLHDRETYLDEVCEMLITDLSLPLLDKNGDASDGSVVHGNKTMADPAANSITYMNTTDGNNLQVYRVEYDWRLSPVVLAERLEPYIDSILAETGAQKVNIVARCLGCEIAYAYLQREGCAEKVDKCVFYASTLDGIGMLNAMFTGDIVLQSGAVDRFAKYFVDNKNIVIQDQNTTDLILNALNLFDRINALSIGLDAVSLLIDSVKDDIIPRVLRETYGNYPSYWAMMSTDCVEEAISYIYGGYETEYAGLIEKIRTYAAQKTDSHNKLSALAENIDFHVICSYGFPDIPISDDAEEESDLFIATGKSSLGATCCNTNAAFSEEYIASRGENAKYINPESSIDASTCLFPDTTWFIKNRMHTVFPDCVNDLIRQILVQDNMTVWNTAYTQYMLYTSTQASDDHDANKGTLTPITKKEDTPANDEVYETNLLRSLYRFFLSLLTKLLDLIFYR